MKFRIIIIGFSLVVFSTCKKDPKILDGTVTPDPSDTSHAWVYSDCYTNNAHDDSLFMADAKRIVAALTSKDLSSPYYDSVFLPQQLVDTIHKMLIAIYNTKFPARDSVVDRYYIHLEDPLLNKMEIAMPDTCVWMQQWYSGNLITGNTSVDNLVSKYSLHLDTLIYSSWIKYYFADISTNYDLNIYTLAREFEKTGAECELYALNYYADDIIVKQQPQYYEFKFWQGWGDCDNGCINWHYWVFKVHDGCKVEYCGSGGSPMTWRISKNPTFVKRKIKYE